MQAASAAGLRTCILRLAAIYGPGRGVRQRLRAGDYKLIDGGEHWISRIHIDDLVRVIFAAEERAPQGSLYLVSDDCPTTQREYALWLCERLRLPEPASVQSYAPGAPRTFLRGRRVRNDKMKRELGIELRYPSYREGEAQIEAEESAGAPAPAPVPAPEAAPAPAPVPVPVPVPVPDGELVAQAAKVQAALDDYLGALRGDPEKRHARWRLFADEFERLAKLQR